MRPQPTSESSLRDIILYILEGNGPPIGETDIELRKAAAMLSAGQPPLAVRNTLLFMLGKKQDITKAEIDAAKWISTLRRITNSRLNRDTHFNNCLDLLKAQINMRAPSKEAKTFVLPENFAATILMIIDGKEKIQSAATKTKIPLHILREYAIDGRVPVNKDSIDELISKLEAAFPKKAFLSPLLRVYAEKNPTVSQVKRGKEVDVALLRTVAIEILVRVRKQLNLTPEQVEEKLASAAAGTFGANNRKYEVARVALRKGVVCDLENNSLKGKSTFASCLHSISSVLDLEVARPAEAKLLTFLARTISLS